ncbi:SPOR domain-containing protein [Oerskovia flava]|uniref:SPOR domain-containing protein n=1 Tax=Oerskovia flava TaxID=2986422 RepID=UPI0022408D16|nr:SPOR domain-containing protein [Oerskovia sp. JB1-3-2]
MNSAHDVDPDEPGEPEDFYYDTRTGEVARGPVASWTHRMGPYPTREAAENALATARERSEAWDEEDRREREE